MLMRILLFVGWLVLGAAVWAQNSRPADPASAPAPSNSQTPAASTPSKPPTAPTPNLEPPRSDSVNADALGEGESSSKNTLIDLSPPADDAKVHPQGSEILKDAEPASGNGEVNEFHPWNPHKAAKDVEVGDFYFKRKNYRAAEDRYREALLYKDNDAIATFRLAICLEKMDQPDQALKEFESYVKILPHGPQAEDARKAIERLKGSAASTKAAQ
ncbi:MAG TPA: tetratricopeptide repeat protein [Candidatus Acidoferrum sp.]|nr:tetratricopeptide repeat protein [Candidatus Acidoferrum sp.]